MYVPNTMNDRHEAGRIRITSPSEFVAAIPALLGFHPDESIIAVLVQGKTLVCTIRAYLDDNPTPLAGMICNAAGNGGADAVLLAMYTARDTASTHSYAHILAATLTCEGLLVGDALLVHPDRFWSLLCQDPECCPPDGTPIHAGTTQLESEQIAQGHLAVAPSRQALAQQYAPRTELVADPQIYRSASRSLGLPLAVRCEQAISDLRLLVAATHRPDHRLVQREPVELARIRLTLLLDDITVRDYLLGTLASGPDDPASAEALTQLALTAPNEVRPAVAVTAAVAQAAFAGSPVAIWALLDLAEETSLARLMTSAIHAGFTPDQIRDVLVSALPEIRERIST